jgi:PPOX class probable F420-dependent enzyme
MPADIDQAKYVSFTSYKKDGSPVSLPVWVVPFDGGYAFTTDRDSYKVRRISRDPRASLRICDIRGNVPNGAETHSGTAVVLDSHDSDRVSALVRKKYRIGTVLLGVKAIVDKIRRTGSEPGNTAIKVTLDK